MQNLNLRLKNMFLVTKQIKAKVTGSQRAFRINCEPPDSGSFALVQSLAVCLFLISAQRHQPQGRSTTHTGSEK